MISIHEAADNIMTAIDVDIETGWVPADVASFSELHGHVDANDYALEASPFAGPSCVCPPTVLGCDCAHTVAWCAYMDHLNAIEAEVNRRLRFRALALRHVA